MKLLRKNLHEIGNQFNLCCIICVKFVLVRVMFHYYYHTNLQYLYMTFCLPLCMLEIIKGVYLCCFIFHSLVWFYPPVDVLFLELPVVFYFNTFTIVLVLPLCQTLSCIHFMVCLVPSNYALLLILNFIYVTILCPPYFLVTEFVKSTPTYCLLLPEIFYFIPESLSLYHMLVLTHPSSNFFQIHFPTSFLNSILSLCRVKKCR